MPKAKALTNYVQFAKALGISRMTIYNWQNRDDWPVSRKAPWTPVDLATVKAWAEKTIAPKRMSSGATGSTAELQRQLLAERRERLALENAQTRGELHAKAACQTAIVRKIHYLKRELLESPDLAACRPALEDMLRRWAVSEPFCVDLDGTGAEGVGDTGAADSGRVGCEIQDLTPWPVVSARPVAARRGTVSPRHHDAVHKARRQRAKHPKGGTDRGKRGVQKHRRQNGTS
jgi:predicted DNA-binding transcriptional regulator AlpA